MLRTITSTQNTYIKKLKTLKTKKGRTATNLFIADGEKCTSEAIEYGYADSVLSTDESHPIVQKALSACIDVYIVSEAVMNCVSEAKTPQSTLAVVKLKNSYSITYGQKLYVALEDVSDPQNLGTIIRTADAAGASAVILSRNCADYTSPKAVRAAMGSIFHVPIIIAEDFIACLLLLKQNDTTLIAGHLEGGNSLPRCKSSCILIGNESRGLSDEVSSIADVLYKINIFGKAESLNAAVAAGILIYKIIDAN